jgi:hypothetical protein
MSEQKKDGLDMIIDAFFDPIEKKEKEQEAKITRLQELINRTIERNIAMSNIIKLTAEMRTAQKVYFDSLGQHSYHRTKLKNASKVLELKLDALILRLHQKEAGHIQEELLLF